MVRVKIEQTIKPAPSRLEATQVPRHLSESSIDSSSQDVWIYSHYQAFEQKMDDFSHRPPNRACRTRDSSCLETYPLEPAWNWASKETANLTCKKKKTKQQKSNKNNLCVWSFTHYHELVVFCHTLHVCALKKLCFPGVPFATSSISLWCFGSKRLALWRKWKNHSTTSFCNTNFHGPPKPTFLEAFMVNNLVF